MSPCRQQRQLTRNRPRDYRRLDRAVEVELTSQLDSSKDLVDLLIGHLLEDVVEWQALQHVPQFLADVSSEGEEQRLVPRIVFVFLLFLDVDLVVRLRLQEFHRPMRVFAVRGVHRVKFIEIWL